MNQKKALVTGASSGIGYVFANELGKDGYLVTCVARSEDKLKNLVRTLGVERDLPQALAYEPEVVVSEALKTLKNRKLPSFFSGPRYRWLTGFANRLLSRKKIIEMMGKANPVLQ